MKKIIADYTEDALLILDRLRHGRFEDVNEVNEELDKVILFIKKIKELSNER